VTVDGPGRFGNERRIFTRGDGIRRVAKGSGGYESGDNAAKGTFHGFLKLGEPTFRSACRQFAKKTPAAASERGPAGASFTVADSL
jgi:hypothetical protein